MTILRLLLAVGVLAGIAAYLTFGEWPQHFKWWEWTIVIVPLTIAICRFVWLVAAGILLAAKQKKESSAIAALDLRPQTAEESLLPPHDLDAVGPRPMPEPTQAPTTEAEPAPSTTSENPPRKRKRSLSRGETITTAVVVTTTTADQAPANEGKPKQRPRGRRTRGLFGQKAPPKAPEAHITH